MKSQNLIRINSVLSSGVKEKIKAMALLARTQLLHSANAGAALGSLKTIITSGFPGVTAAQIDIIAYLTLYEAMRSTNQGVADQVMSLLEAGASPEEIAHVVKRGQMEYLAEAVRLLTSTSKTTHDLAMTIIQNIRA